MRPGTPAGPLSHTYWAVAKRLALSATHAPTSSALPHAEPSTSHLAASCRHPLLAGLVGVAAVPDVPALRVEVHQPVLVRRVAVQAVELGASRLLRLLVALARRLRAGGWRRIARAAKKDRAIFAAPS